MSAKKEPVVGGWSHDCVDQPPTATANDRTGQKAANYGTDLQTPRR